jgi:hypothetical protein
MAGVRVEGLGAEIYAELDRRLAPVDEARLAAYPGERPDRQPVHTCYVPADAVVPGLAGAWGTAALAALDEHGLPDLGLDPALVEEVLPRVRAKLATEPVEDLRVDAEDGYRRGPDAEDDDVRRAAAIVAADRRTQREPSRRSEIAGSTTAGAVGGAVTGGVGGAVTGGDGSSTGAWGRRSNVAVTLRA